MFQWRAAILICLNYLLKGTNSYTTWKPLCDSNSKDFNLSLTETACSGSDYSVVGTTQNLSITPHFTRFFLDGTEKRWYPGWNISWFSDNKKGTKQYTMRLSYRGKHGFPTVNACDQCLLVTMITANPAVTEACQRISLITTEEIQEYCEVKERPKFMYVQVMGIASNEIIAANSVSLPVDTTTTKGLPACYRRGVPSITMSPCCNTWISPLVVRNSSCHRSIIVEFEMAPGRCIEGYQIRLEREGRSVLPPKTLNRTEHAAYGQVAFTNLPLGSYYVSLKILPMSEKNTDVVSGYLTISEASNCSREIWHISTNGEGNTGTLLVTPVVIALAIVLTILMAIVLVFLVRWRCRDYQHTFPQQIKMKPEEPTVQPRHILLVYAMDNEAHMMVVKKFARLLHEACGCYVSFDQWQRISQLEDGMGSWVARQYENCDKVIIIGSEGVYRYIGARNEGSYWPQLEEDFNLAKSSFPYAYNALQRSAGSYNRSKSLVVTFPYTKNAMGSEYMKELSCNDIHYSLPDHLDRLILSVNDIGKYSFGNNMMELANNILETDDGKQILKAIHKAASFHDQNPKWFIEKYGDPIRRPEKEKVPKADLINTEKMYVTKEPEEFNFTSPDELAKEFVFESDIVKRTLRPPDECVDAEDSLLPQTVIMHSESVSFLPPDDNDSISISDTDSNIYDTQMPSQMAFIKPRDEYVAVPVKSSSHGQTSPTDGQYDSGIGISTETTASGLTRTRSQPLRMGNKEEAAFRVDSPIELYPSNGHGLIDLCPPSSVSSASSFSSLGSCHSLDDTAGEMRVTEAKHIGPDVR